MPRFYDLTGWFLSSLGVSLLICGLVLVPQNRSLLANPPVFTTGCPGHDTCNSGCANRTVGSCASALLVYCSELTKENCDLCGCTDEDDRCKCK